ncbi:hypothetical protein L2E82_26731 [Cichorium intybus]|uniref:Uncharacterized protein n=1 Tax=Cichorium intybus TaxID=13427 RepID=A0ACB9CR84_CICIN|nr:hypothetical protein L2E82_26731 [Cichorium intybus]
MVRSNILSYNMIAATYHSQIRSSSPQMNYELRGSVLSFNRMIESRPVPPVREFNHILIKIAKMKQYPTAISLILDHDLLGSNSFVKPNLYTFSIAINCFCHMDRVAFGFSVYGNMFKLGYRPDCAIINTLVRGLCYNGLIYDAMKFADESMNNGLQPTVVTIGTIINGYCKRGYSQDALILIQDVEKTMGCQPVIQGFLRHNETKRALSYLESMLDAGFSASASTSTKLVYLLTTKDLDKASKEVLKKFFSLWNKKVRCGGKRARRGIRFRSNLCLVANEYGIKLRKKKFRSNLFNRFYKVRKLEVKYSKVDFY